MDVVTAIMNDHRVLEGLFEELKSGDEDRAVLIAEIKARLYAHSRAEERYVYPALARLRPSQVVQHGVEEHREADDKLAELQAASEDDSSRALKEFIDAVSRHVDEEESELLPAIKAAMSYRKRDELGRRFESSRINELRRAGIDDALTKEDLYIKAQRAGIAGRSTMSRSELARALLAARTHAARK